MHAFSPVSNEEIALPVLFKKTSTGALQFWEIRVAHKADHSVIRTRYGQFDGKIQETEDVVKEGKNVGKKNATTFVTQSEADAMSKFESKLKDGYVDSKAKAEAGEVDAIIEGGVEPMLAQGYDKHAAKITFPCLTQPKLDGIRCIAMIQNGTATLWTRSRKRITSCPHIEAELIRQLPNADIILDGELYNHDLKNDFEKIISAVRKDEPSEESKAVQYHIYDVVHASDFQYRTNAVDVSVLNTESIRKVMTFWASDEEELQTYFKKFRDAGYEGAMARNAAGGYEQKRSYNLQKVKEFEDAEFEIVGVSEGKGKLRGNVGAFVCKTAAGDTFEAKPKGNQDQWKPYLVDHSLWTGKLLVVQFQGLTNKNGVPRFPVGLRLKDRSIEG